MTCDHSAPERPTSPVSRPSRASGRALAAVLGLMVVLAAPAGEAAGGRPRLGWSSAPRWRLPAVRAPDCPQGYASERGGRVAPVRKARCVGTGPEGQVAKDRSQVGAREPARLPGVRDDPAPALPGVRDEPGRPGELERPREDPGRSGERERPGRGELERPRPGRSPTIAAGPDATALMKMDAARCHAYLNEREVPFEAVARRTAPEVAIPVRLTGAVAGVQFTIPWSDDLDRDPHAIWDCRLVAAIVPLAEFLHAHGVTEVQYFSALRRGKIVRDKPRSQHNVGLALDLLGVRGPAMALATVEQTYPKGRLRACPTASAPGNLGAPVPAGAAAADLYLALVCQAYARGLFHTILTPDHDRAHANHLHLDLKAAQPSPADPFLSVS